MPAGRFPSTIGSHNGRLASSGFINSSSSGALQQYASYGNDGPGNQTTLSSSYPGFYSSGQMNQTQPEKRSTATAAVKEARDKLALLSQERVILE